MKPQTTIYSHLKTGTASNHRNPPKHCKCCSRLHNPCKSRTEA